MKILVLLCYLDLIDRLLWAVRQTQLFTFQTLPYSMFTSASHALLTGTYHLEEQFNIPISHK